MLINILFSWQAANIASSTFLCNFVALSLLSYDAHLQIIAFAIATDVHGDRVSGIVFIDLSHGLHVSIGLARERRQQLRLFVICLDLLREFELGVCSTKPASLLIDHIVVNLAQADFLVVVLVLRPEHLYQK